MEEQPGYYSKTQHERNKVLYKYLGKEVYVTEISSIKRTGSDLTQYFEDNEYKGVVLKFIGKNVTLQLKCYYNI